MIAYTLTLPLEAVCVFNFIKPFNFSDYAAFKIVESGTKSKK